MFLAVCIELLKLWRHKERYGNLEMLSGLPVSIDGLAAVINTLSSHASKV